MLGAVQGKRDNQNRQARQDSQDKVPGPLWAAAMGIDVDVGHNALTLTLG